MISGAEVVDVEGLPDSFAVCPSDVLKLFIERNSVFVAHVSARLQQGRLIVRRLPAVINENSKILLAAVWLSVKTHSPKFLWILKPTVRHQWIDLRKQCLMSAKRVRLKL